MNPWHSLEGKTVWVVGGADYPGSAITEALDEQWEKIICIDPKNKASALVRKRSLCQTIPVSFDIANEDGLEAFVGQTIRGLGLPHGVVYLAFASRTDKGVNEFSKNDFDEALDFALPSGLIFCRTLAERIKARGFGSIVLLVNMHRVADGVPHAPSRSMASSQIEHCENKAAVLEMIHDFAAHYGPTGIRFNRVKLGPNPNFSIQHTKLNVMQNFSHKIALRHIGQNLEIVGPTHFLLTDSASLVTGHSLVVDRRWTGC